MPRIARIVVPGVAHHVIQRGNRQQSLFFGDADRKRYVTLLVDACSEQKVRCLAWCLMDNHIHLILVPESSEALSRVTARVHTAYSQHVNRLQGASGHLFQGRYRSYAMDDAHLMVAVRYVENNPVAAGMVARAGDWPWSSARAHLGLSVDPLTDVPALARHVANWRAMLTDGLEAGDSDDRVEIALRSGQPLAEADWIAAHGLERPLPKKRGPKSRATA